MKKLIIKKISNYNYQLEDEFGNKYQLNMEFHSLNKKLVIGNIMFIPEQLLKNNAMYTFGPIKEELFDVDEYIKIIIDNKEYYLQRYYG